MSAYFTVFAWSYLKLHATKSENADELYERHLGTAESIFKVRGNAERCDPGVYPTTVQTAGRQRVQGKLVCDLSPRGQGRPYLLIHGTKHGRQQEALSSLGSPETQKASFDSLISYSKDTQ